MYITLCVMQKIQKTKRDNQVTTISKMNFLKTTPTQIIQFKYCNSFLSKIEKL